MKESPKLWSFLGFSVTSLSGTLLHFLYEWSGKSPVVAAVSGVNESTWEHMKLLFFPMFLFAVIEGRFFADCQNFWCTKLQSITLGLFLIPALFYTYNGAFGTSPDFVNIGIYYVSAAVAYIYESRRLGKCRRKTWGKVCFVLLLLIAAAFVVFTFYPPHIPLFQDPLTNTYGI